MQKLISCFFLNLKKKNKALLPLSPPRGGGAYEEIREAELL
jgi:hypothetical protein